MKKLPAILKKYFWDVKFEDINLIERRSYVLKRILEYGDKKAVVWMRRNFKKSEIKDVLCRYRGYSRKSAGFWAFILNIPKEEVLCLRKHSLKEQKTFWPH